MRVLLVKPPDGAKDFGLAPFFRTEPLGLQYIATALRQHGHSADVADLRFDRRSFNSILRDSCAGVVGISCVHILDAEATMSLAEAVKRHSPETPVIVGGHAASMYPAALARCRSIDAVALGEGESRFSELCHALSQRRGLETVPGLLIPDGSGTLAPTEDSGFLASLDAIAPPDREAVARYQRHYCCLNYAPVWTIETARGCQHRCRFCSVWEFHRRSVRFHPLDAVCADFRATGPNVFIVDDMFWAGQDRSLALADALAAAGIRKHWLLAQSRLDTVVEHPELLERWRARAKNFDIFFGFEAPTSRGLRALHKDVDVDKTIEAVRIARKLNFGVTGNFIIDPDYLEEDFEELWSFLEQHQLSRVGFTILTPLPGTQFYERMREHIELPSWSHFDLHHLPWQPRLPVQRFFELYCESWRRSVLNLQGRKKWWKWLPQVRLRDLGRIARILVRTQKLMEPAHYLEQHDLRDNLPSIARSVGDVPTLAQDVRRPAVATERPSLCSMCDDDPEKREEA